MDCDRFLEELQSRLGGETRQEELVLGSAPRLYTHCQGFFVKFDFVTTAEIIIDVNTKPPHRLRVRKEGWLSRAADHVPLLADHKTGDEAFDREYEIDNATSEQVLRFFTDEVKSLIRSLEPFASFELTHKEYRCFKVLESSEEYTPAKAHADIDALVRIARIAEELPRSAAVAPKPPSTSSADCGREEHLPAKHAKGRERKVASRAGRTEEEKA